VDGKLVGREECISYEWKNSYDNNGIGICLEDEESFNWCGEMSPMHFFAVSSEEFHNLLSSLYNIVSMSDIKEVLAGNITHWRRNKVLAMKCRKEIISHKGFKKKLIVSIDSYYEEVDENYKDVKLHLNVSARTAFGNIGGVKALLPVLENAIQSNTDTSFM